MKRRRILIRAKKPPSVPQLKASTRNFIRAAVVRQPCIVLPISLHVRILDISC